MTQQTQQYITPQCPNCGEPITKVSYTGWQLYRFNASTGQYDGDDGSGSMVHDCGHDLTEELFPEGIDDYKQRSIEEWKQEHPKEDYGICDDCKEGFDLWKYGDLKSAGHEGHRVREPTDQEYEEAVKMCLEDGCKEE